MKFIFKIILAISVMLLMAINVAFAQTCSCAGAPLLGSQSAGAGGAGNLLVGFTYEFNQITNLYNGSNQLENDSAERNTQSGLLEIHYGLSDRLSLSGTFSIVRKERISGLRNPTGSETSVTDGFGDGIVMVRYVLSQQSLWNRYHVALGAGTKAPLGTTSLTNINGLQFNADMQPGSGSWDGIFWSQLGLSLLPRSTMSLSWVNSYRLTGRNERFTNTDFYQFGNELISNLTVNDSITDRFSYGISLRYRSSSSDQRNNISMPNTGGKWVSIIPDLYASINEKVSFKLSGQIPIYQYLKGTQPTTTYALSGSIFLNFNSSKNAFIYGN